MKKAKSVRAQYRFELASEVPFCVRCKTVKGEKSKFCGHKPLDRMKHFKEVKKLLVKQFGAENVIQSVEGMRTVLTVES